MLDDVTIWLSSLVSNSYWNSICFVVSVFYWHSIFLLPKIINCAVHSAILFAKSDVMIFFNILQKYVLRKFNIFVIYVENSSND
jgi:hypothetical protein